MEKQVTSKFKTLQYNDNNRLYKNGETINKLKNFSSRIKVYNSLVKASKNPTLEEQEHFQNVLRR